MRRNTDQGAVNSRLQAVVLGVLGLVALCSLLGAAFVVINKQFNPPVPTALPTSAAPTQAPSLAPATRDIHLTLPPTTTPPAAGTLGTPLGPATETLAPLASETLGAPSQAASSTPHATETLTATLPPNTATAAGPTRTARPRFSPTPRGPATAGPTVTNCFDC